jgi:hypothetical protein
VLRCGATIAKGESVASFDIRMAIGAAVTLLMVLIVGEERPLI